jgi:hypothetical protein
VHWGAALTRRPRVIVALPDRTEGSLVANWLSENQFEPVQCPTPEAAASEIQARAFDLLIADAIWALSAPLKSIDRVRNSPAPTILIADATAPPSAAANGQAMCLTRPIDLAVLSCFISMALMDGKPVRRSPRKTVQRFDALVNDVSATIVDVSAEGLRVEVPRVPPPFFAVRIPLVGVAIIAKRMWTMSPPKHTSPMWCGCALSNNRPSSEEAWRAFVDTVPVIGSATAPSPSRPSPGGTRSGR